MDKLSEHKSIAFSLESLATAMLNRDNPSWNEIDEWIIFLQACQERLNTLSKIMFEAQQ